MWILSKKVVIPNPIKPRGAGLAFLSASIFLTRRFLLLENLCNAQNKLGVKTSLASFLFCQSFLRPNYIQGCSHKILVYKSLNLSFKFNWPDINYIRLIRPWAWFTSNLYFWHLNRGLTGISRSFLLIINFNFTKLDF